MHLKQARGIAVGSPEELAMTSEPDGPPQDALFQIEGPDEDGFVWICSNQGRDNWCHKLGPTMPTVAVLARWLASVRRRADI